MVGLDGRAHPEELIENSAHLVIKDLDELLVAGAGAARSEGERRAIRDLPSALHEDMRIMEWLIGRTPAVFLDYDGTLTPIVGDPAKALLPSETREVIERLATVCTVAIISGRDLADVQAMVGISGLVYAGSHGFDIVGPGGSLRDQERGRPFLPALGRAEKALLEAIENVPGARFERKLFAIAVHYRAVRDKDVPSVERAVDRVAAQEPLLRKSGGKKLFELRPNTAWDKGRALLHLLDVLGLDKERTVPLFIGDDVTDEDAFGAIRDVGIGIVVGRDDRLTVAKYALQDPAEVTVFLRRLIDLAGKSSR